ncbi:pyrroline-5-carboxylate reductase [Oxalobacter vibrioformis]|uniref:Pyrroline-5-carboxylate reductase n=1 Tax=Oxalobacter vibrioformis TaxID=933080 RepID=A0A9E9LXG1_9BURK|nr:pyrroline-5-carboxylate reductase [Oxalobacter vibrioformis]NLC24128.1 pyrroline-5-carboxylate reductase [Oxalobacter sp.]WAW09385.1 pyrroline-5-carboxylate reductase [Oxalobacter vibrioformis]
MNIGFLGAGNMATSIIRGMLASGFTKPQNIYATARDQEKLKRFAEATRINICADNEQLVEVADVLMLSIKPDMFDILLPPLSRAVAKKNPLVVSVAAGTSMEKIGVLLGGVGSLPIVRVIPSINVEIGQSMTGICCNRIVSEEQSRFVFALFDTLGRTMAIEESQFGVFSAVACASPAFVFMFIEALARGGLKGGMSMRDALIAAAQAVMGSAQFVLECKEHPAVLMDRVTSPGGTTIAGVMALEEDALRASVMRAVDAVGKRDAELLQK